MVSLFDKVTVPQTGGSDQQVNDISSISEIYYADGSMIGAIESDFHWTSVASDFRQSQAGYLLQQRMNILQNTRQVNPKAVIRASLETLSVWFFAGTDTK